MLGADGGEKGGETVTEGPSEGELGSRGHTLVPQPGPSGPLLRVG